MDYINFGNVDVDEHIFNTTDESVIMAMRWTWAKSFPEPVVLS